MATRDDILYRADICDLRDEVHRARQVMIHAGVENKEKARLEFARLQAELVRTIFQACIDADIDPYYPWVGQGPITVVEAARQLRVTPGRINHFIKDGRLPAEKHSFGYLIDPADLEAFVRSRA